ncbi:MAG: recombinase family protein [Gammaproteobacteria bacterium]|nr:recombinase family protein [Gammaproteobacteria bacterium]
MKYGYARVSPGGKSESVDAQARQLTKAGCRKVFRDVHVSGAKTDRAQLRRVIDALEPGDVLMVTRLDRLARSTRDLLNTLAAITAKKAGFRSLGDTWADTTTSHGRLMLTVLGGLAEFERDLIRARTAEGRERAKARGVKMDGVPVPNLPKVTLRKLSDFNGLRDAFWDCLESGGHAACARDGSELGVISKRRPSFVPNLPLYTAQRTCSSRSAPRRVHRIC